MRLLIVEDDRDGREMLTELFRMRGWLVTAVSSTTAGMRELRRGGFDVVISDEDLDGESGSSMLRDACAAGLLGSVGALMYTAEPGSLEVPAGVRVLHKPLALTALVNEASAVVTSLSDVRKGPRSGRRLRPPLEPLESSSRLTPMFEASESPPSSRAH